MINYRWSCQVCGVGNEPASLNCDKCGFQSSATGEQIEKAKKQFNLNNQKGSLAAFQQDSITVIVKSENLSETKFSLAHPGKRFQGQFIDALITYALGFATFYLSGMLISKELAFDLGLLSAFVYYIFSDGLPNGQSLGKRLLNIQVVDIKTLKPATFWQSFRRNITSPLGLFDWITIFFGSHRRIGDFLASTIVIKKGV